ncbi:MAG: flavoprotein [Desulfoferrobacter sp.]
MNEEQVQRLVAEVIKRVAVRLGADGDRGLIIAVFTGATVEFDESVQQLRQLILQGYRIQFALSKAAEGLYGQVLRDQLEGFPHSDRVDSTKWLSALHDARAVVVPLLSVNTLSKLALLMPDNVPTNIVLHALFMGKPVIAARNGVDPHSEGRKKLGFHQGTAALNAAVRDRLVTLSDYGCRLTDVRKLGEAVKSLLELKHPLHLKQSITSGPPRPLTNIRQKVITAAQVTHAHRAGLGLQISSGCLVTPLARDLASRLGVVLCEIDEVSKNTGDDSDRLLGGEQLSGNL